MKRKFLAFLLAFVLCVSLFPTAAVAADSPAGRLERAESLAADLRSLGLFQGVSETDFDLERAPTRAEALVMLIRVLGKEREAVGAAWDSPFGDVAPWAENYIGYAYQNGLTLGISDTEFGAGNAGAEMYITFLLRALGYSDAEFSWADPYPLAREIGLYDGDGWEGAFLRADVVLLSYAALEVRLKDSAQTLAEKLILDGVFTRAQYEGLARAEEGGQETPRTELTAREIYARCAPAVFCIYTYDSNGQYSGQGSGFFVDESGIAVTNYHVMEDTLSATAALTDGRELEITGVLYYDADIDYAVIQVEGSGFPTLTIGDSSAVQGGEIIYTIGNPKGLTSTISDGLVSNPRRDDYYGYIQISAPISAGSSGGALINAYGEVIGITTSAYREGQNLNFAAPINAVTAGGDITDRSGMRTLRQFAVEIGYITEQSSRALAFQALSGFLMRNYNETLGNRPSYAYRDTNAGVLFRVIYSSYENEIILSSVMYGQSGATCYSYMYLSAKQAPVYAEFSYYAAGAASPMCTANCSINPSSLRLDAGFAFGNYTGPAELRADCEELALHMFYNSAAWLGSLYQTRISPDGTYSISDLGFYAA